MEAQEIDGNTCEQDEAAVGDGLVKKSDGDRIAKMKEAFDLMGYNMSDGGDHR